MFDFIFFFWERRIVIFRTRYDYKIKQGFLDKDTLNIERLNPSLDYLMCDRSLSLWPWTLFPKHTSSSMGILLENLRGPNIAVFLSSFLVSQHIRSCHAFSSLFPSPVPTSCFSLQVDPIYMLLRVFVCIIN